MRVMKFGGTSVRDAECISAVSELVEKARSKTEVCVVVSALGGITDELHATVANSARGERVFEERCRAMARRHQKTAAALLQEQELSRLAARIDERFRELARTLEGVALLHECSPRTLAKVLSTGELLSSEIVAATLRQRGLDADACDARDLIVTDQAFTAARVDFDATEARIVDYFSQPRPLQVVTGFLARSHEGETTTLGRGGSDYTASLLGAALEVERIEIWTDVDGVLSSDPRQVEAAFSLESLSYDELLELSHFGAKVVYPPAVHPARSKSVPLLIKNTFNPSFPGTRIQEGTKPGDDPIRGISAMPQIVLLRLEGDGMTTIPAATMRLFDALGRGEIKTLLISQASGEHSICFAVEPGKADDARKLIHEEFRRERETGLIDDLVVDEELSIVAVVGAGMNHHPGISGRLFDALGRAAINVRAIAQGSSELNISFAVASSDERRVLQLLHATFFEEPKAHIVLAGVGAVGRTLLEQLRDTAPHPSWSLSGLLNSRRMSLCSNRSDASIWRADLLEDDQSAVSNLDVCAEFMIETQGRRVLVDCTASRDIESIYPKLLRRGVSIVTANKNPLASTTEVWEAIHQALDDGQGRLFFEATVGAGLPVIRTLQSQLATGDELRSVEGLFSGTLGFLMSEMRAGRDFSQALREAQEKGYTEPDPREDLSGFDVARKLLILARLAGATLEIADIQVDSLLPSTEWSELSLDEFWQRLPDLDSHFAALIDEAKSGGRVLTYLARWDGSQARVGLDALDADHPCAAVEGSDNLFSFETRRYADSPLVVRGPGAGPGVTAAGVYGDLRRALEGAAR